MGGFVIYGKDGVAKCEVAGLEYRGEFLGERLVTVDVMSAVPVAFAVGDYLEYRGERFTLGYVPGVTKSGSRGSKGDAFSYKDVKLVSDGAELARCLFLDVVSGDSNVHYTSLSRFSFFAADVRDVVMRLQANLDRMYGAGMWEISVHSGFVGKKDVHIDVDNETVWDVLGRCVDAFEVTFTINGRVVTLGAPAVDLGGVLEYGKGNGLYELSQAGDADAGVVTRLYVYGSERNLPWRYYNKLREPYALVPISGVEYNVSGDDSKYAWVIFDHATGVKLAKGSEVRWLGETYEVLSTTPSGNNDALASGKPFVYWPDIENWAAIYFLRNMPVKRVDDVWMLNMKAGPYLGTDIYYICLNYAVRGEKVDDELAERVTYGVNFMGYSYEHAWNLLCVYLRDKLGVPSENIPSFYAFKQACVWTIIPSPIGIEAYYEANMRVVFSTSYKITNIPDANSPSTLEVLYAANGSVLPDNVLTGNHNGPMLSDHMAVKNLMLPDFPQKTLNPYLDSANIGEYGVREGVVIMDGSDEEWEEIYPSLEGMTAEQVRGAGYVVSLPAGDNGRLDEILGVERGGESGVIEEGGDVGTFVLELKDLGFDLVKSVQNAGGQCTVAMKSGACVGMEFDVEQVYASDREDGVKSWMVRCKRNLDDATQLCYPNTGMPVVGGDSFVLLDIEMPEVYVKAASVRLLEAGERYLATVDEWKSTYAPKIDEIEMARQHDRALAKGGVSYHDTIREGMLLRISDGDLGGVELPIDQLTIKEGDGIPRYEVVLKDEKEEGTIKAIQDKIDGIGARVTVVNGGSSVTSDSGTVSDTLEHLRVSKMVTVGESAVELDHLGGIRGEQAVLAGGMVTKDYVPGESGARVDGSGAELGDVKVRGDVRSVNYADGPLGAGFALMKKNAAGRSYLEVDELYVRMKAVFDALEVKHMLHTGGVNILSPAGMKVAEVSALSGISSDPSTGSVVWDSLTDIVVDENGDVLMDETWDGVTVGGYLLRFVVDDGETAVENEFRVGDLARCQDFNIAEGVHEGVSNRFYWRRVIAVGADWIVLSNASGEMAAGSDVPKPGDNVVTVGSATDANRQNVIELRAVGEGSPSITQYAGVDGFTLDGKMVTRIGPDGNVFTGDFKISSSSDFDGYNVAELFSAVDDAFSSTYDELDGLQARSDALEKLTSDLQNQIDGKIDFHFGGYVPTLENAPANEWTTDALKEEHENDTFTNTEGGESYRWVKKDGVWLWLEITDSQAAAALEAAGKAQAAADGKMTAYVGSVPPSPPYSVGDLWMNATYGGFENEILRCVTGRASGETFSLADWVRASGYTDDSLAQDALNEAQNAMQAAIDAGEDAVAALSSLDDINSDGVVSAPEKGALRQQLADMEAEYAEVRSDALRYLPQTSPLISGYEMAYSSAHSALVKYTAQTPLNIAVGADYADIAAYYSSRQALLYATAQAAKSYADSVKNDLDEYKTAVSSEFELTNSKITQAVNSAVTKTVPNLFLNGSFERELGDGYSIGPASVARVNGVGAPFGEYALKVSVGNDDFQFAYLLGSSVPVNEGDELTVVLRRKASVAVNDGAASGVWFDKQLNPVSPLQLCDEGGWVYMNPSWGVDWETVTLKVTAPKGSRSMILRLGRQGGVNPCDLFVDGVMVVRGHWDFPVAYPFSENETDVLVEATRSELSLLEGRISARVDKLGDDLEATGIDIEHKKVTVTSDQFEVRNNSGDVTARVNADGVLETNGGVFRGDVTLRTLTMRVSDADSDIDGWMPVNGSAVVGTAQHVLPKLALGECRVIKWVWPLLTRSQLVSAFKGEDDTVGILPDGDIMYGVRYWETSDTGCYEFVGVGVEGLYFGSDVQGAVPPVTTAWYVFKMGEKIIKPING